MVEDQDDNLDEVRRLYPDMTDEELRISRDNLRRYLEILLGMAERLRKEGKSINDPE